MHTSVSSSPETITHMYLTAKCCEGKIAFANLKFNSWLILIHIPESKKRTVVAYCVNNLQQKCLQFFCLGGNQRLSWSAPANNRELAGHIPCLWLLYIHPHNHFGSLAGKRSESHLHPCSRRLFVRLVASQNVNGIKSSPCSAAMFSMHLISISELIQMLQRCMMWKNDSSC